MPTTVRRTPERLARLHLLAERGPLTKLGTLKRRPSGDSLWEMHRAGLFTWREIDQSLSKQGHPTATLEFAITAAGRAWLAAGSAARATTTTRRAA